MLRAECDKIYKGKCSCLGLNARTKLENEAHWCESQTHEATIIDTYYLPPNTTRYYGQKGLSLTQLSSSVFKQLEDEKKVLISKESRKVVSDSYDTQLRVTMKWFREGDFLPTWIWMIESGWNRERDEWNRQYGIKFIKQVVTNNNRFIVSEGPYTTKTEYLPYHVPPNQNLIEKVASMVLPTIPLLSLFLETDF
jgi:hypothetical protein